MTHMDAAPTLDHSDVSGSRSHEVLTVEETFQQYFALLVYYAKKFRVRDPESTVMNVFEKALKEEKRKGDDAQLYPGWYFRVTHNAALDEKRSSAYKLEDFVDYDPRDRTDGADYASAAAFDAIEFEETMQHVDRVLAEKPSHWKAAIASYALKGDRYREIGEDLGIPAATARTASFRAKELLQADTEFRAAIGKE